MSFPGGRERNTAFAVFGSVAGAGAAVGLVLGGSSPSSPTGAGASSSTSPS
ncbi:hypothetical protein Q0F99_03685 [Rathayibacter oskolensis]|uniref:hypothetical protein n=1 Tax=Rathayibacter oskolensis TaxID=1891671 RepID=UPI00265E35EE|nr:hypothetical protein [Rathayibacter oskolensis]WKK72145.1 hypothetical protein Q0F99_03685 [Rathayibacter oskolensis]